MFLPGFAVWRPARVSDGQGGWTISFAKLADIDGRLSSLGGSEQILADQQKGVVTYRFSTSAATDIKEGDQVRSALLTVLVEAVRITSSGERKECVATGRRP